MMVRPLTHRPPEKPLPRIGITIRETIGIGDMVQFSSLPENYYRATGRKLIDISKPWIFDCNPFVERNAVKAPDETRELWNFPVRWPWPKPLRGLSTYRSNAEIWAGAFGVEKCALIRPRLYYREEYPFHERHRILFHTHGRSHGALPDRVIDHVLTKYKKTGRLYHLCLPGDPDYGIPRLRTSDTWSLVEAISEAQMLIGVDSGPAWIAACYPDVVVKKVRVRMVHGHVPLEEWMPLEADNIHSFWDDRAFMTYNIFDDDIGFTLSYKKL